MVTRVSGLAAVCFLAWGSVTLMAFGMTTVEVTIKKMSSRNMTSVIEAMLNDSLTFVLLLSAISLPVRLVSP